MKQLLRSLLVLCVLAGIAIAANTYIFSDTYTIEGTVAIPVGDNTKPYYLTSVLMNFDPGVELNNTFSFSFVRGGDTNPVIAVTSATMNSVTWFVPGRLYVKRGDTLLFTNTDSTAGRLILNAEF